MGRSPLPSDPQTNGAHRNIPILPSSTKSVSPTTRGDPMDVTPPASAMGPPGHGTSSPELDHSAGQNGTYENASHIHNGPIANGLSAAAATSSQQPKVVQTAFIHKLYKWVALALLVAGSWANDVAVCWKILQFLI